MTATDDRTGQACADDLGRAAWEFRSKFIKPLPSVPEAVEQALSIAASAGDGPVILADVADNPGGGGPGDTTTLLHELVRRKVTGAVGCIWDPETVRRAQEVGINGEDHFQIGGRIAPAQYGAPLEVQGRVTHLEGVWKGGHPRESGPHRP